MLEGGGWCVDGVLFRTSKLMVYGLHQRASGRCRSIARRPPGFGVLGLFGQFTRIGHIPGGGAATSAEEWPDSVRGNAFSIFVVAVSAGPNCVVDADGWAGGRAAGREKGVSAKPCGRTGGPSLVLLLIQSLFVWEL